MAEESVRRWLPWVAAATALLLTPLSGGWAAEGPGAVRSDPAAHVAGTRLDLKELIGEALAQNPEIQRARGRWRASENRPSQAGSMPDPVLMLGMRNVGFDGITRGEEMMSFATVSIGQAIPFPGKLDMRQRIARKDADRIGEIHNATILSVVSRLKVAYFDYFFIEKSIEIIRKDKGLLEQFEKTAEAKFRVGEGIQQDVLKAQVELSRLLERLTIKEQEREEVVARINRILNRPPSTPLPPPAEFGRSSFEYDLEALQRMVLENSPALRAEDHAIERDETALSLARREYLPDFALSAGISDRGQLDNIWEVRLGVEVPFYFWRKQRYGVREASETLVSSMEGRQAVKQSVLYRVKDLYELARTSEDLVELYERGIIPQATLSLQSAVSGYSVGNVDFLTLLDNLITLLEDELRYTREQTQYEKALARLEEVVGVRFTGL